LLASGSELASALIGEALMGEALMGAQRRPAVKSSSGNKSPDYSEPYQILHGYLK